MRITSRATRSVTGAQSPQLVKTLIHDGPIEICSTGLHASRKAWQALEYAPGHRLHRVLCEGIENEQDDKACMPPPNHYCEH